MCVQVTHQFLQVGSRILSLLRILLPPRPEKSERPGVRMSAFGVRGPRASLGRNPDNGEFRGREVGENRCAVREIQNERLCPV